MGAVGRALVTGRLSHAQNRALPVHNRAVAPRIRTRSQVSTDATLDPSAPLGVSVEEDRLRDLYEIGLALLATEEPDQVTALIRDAMAQHLKPAHACVLAIDPTGEYQPLIAHNIDLSSPSEAWALSHTVLKRVRETGLAMLVSDVQSDPRLGESTSVEAFRIRSILCVPLGVPVRGVVYADRRGGKGAFSKADLEFLTAIAVYAALALERTESLTKTRKALESSDERIALLQAELLRHQIVGRSARLLEAYDQVTRFARAGARVLLRGETGTGKELFARAFAQSSPRAGGPYVPVPIPSLSPSIVESELFGHVRGAFTEAGRDKKGRLELAEGGVLFLDEVGDISADVQVKLLRFLDSGELCRVGDTVVRRIEVNVVSATNRPLDKDVADGRFRADLMARLGHVVTLPPLRERLDDIPILVDHFLKVYGGAERGRRFSAAAIERLQSHDWPFNVRELQQVVERAVCLSDKAELGPEDLPAYLSPKGAPSPHASPALSEASTPAPLREIVDDAERAHIRRAIEFAGGNRRRAAEVLGISPDTFYRKLKDLGIDP